MNYLSLISWSIFEIHSVYIYLFQCSSGEFVMWAVCAYNLCWSIWCELCVRITYVEVSWQTTTHNIHVWYVYLHLPWKTTKCILVNIPVPWMVWVIILHHPTCSGHFWRQFLIHPPHSKWEIPRFGREIVSSEVWLEPTAGVTHKLLIYLKKLRWQWQTNHLKMYFKFLLKNGAFPMSC